MANLMGELPREVRGVMIPVTGGRILLPNATVSEVITYTRTEPVADAPAWVLGILRWRGWRLPLISLPMLAGEVAAESLANVRVVVLKALGANPGMPFIALLAQGFPRLTTITPEIMIPTGDENPQAPGVRAEVLVHDDRAIIPDLDAIESMLAGVVRR